MVRTLADTYWLAIGWNGRERFVPLAPWGRCVLEQYGWSAEDSEARVEAMVSRSEISRALAALLGDESPGEPGDTSRLLAGRVARLLNLEE